MARKKPHKLITLDTETYNGLKGKLKRIAIYDGKEIHYGYSFADIEPILKKYSKTYYVHVYIHNLEFDARKIPEIFRKGNVNWGQTKIIGGRYVVIWCKDYILHDSYKLLPMSLKDLSEQFDLEHGKLDLWEEVQKTYPNQYTDIVDFLDRCPIDDELFLRYLGYDVRSLYELIEKLCDVSGLSFDTLTKCMTTASLSKKIFKYGFKGQAFISEGETLTDFEKMCKNKWWSSDKEIKNNHSSKPISYIEIENKIRDAFFGGRTEVFKPYLMPYNNKIVGYHMDVNSLYPSKMIDNLFPIGAPVFYDDDYTIKTKFRVWQRHKQGLGFIRCKIYVPETHIPPLPIKKEKLFFACGYLEGTWTYIELEHALNKYNAEVVEYQEMIHFTATFKVFKNFIETFSKLKEKAKEEENSALYLLSKLLMNTSFGYTALRRDDKTELKDIEKLKQFEDRLIYKNDELGYIEIQSIVLSESIQPQIACYVTSYARLELLEAFETLEEKGADIYYCDTDSIVSNMLLPKEMLHKSKLGLWDVEGELKEAIMIQPKVYYENVSKGGKDKEKIKWKGISKDTRNNMTKKFVLSLYDKLSQGVEDKMLIEENRELLRSIRYLQKTDTSYDAFEVRDKYIYLKNKQKRIMNYTENYTKPYFFNSFEEFESFSFAVNLDLFRDENGNVFNPKL